MHLKYLKITNLRAIEDIEVNFETRVNVIVGPNAIGKTTVLEAIRITKALLAPRTNNEGAQALFSIGASSPHMPQLLLLEAIARDISVPIEIKCNYELLEKEWAQLYTIRDKLAVSLVQGRMGQAFANPAVLMPYLSSEQGKQAIVQANLEIDALLTVLKSNLLLDLHLTLSPAGVRGADPIAGLFLSALDQSFPPNKTIFSYFPADRALPAGEQPIQLGAPDAAQQLESHNSQPHLKYNRLKNTIFNAVIAGNAEKELLESAFKKIFTGVLKGREFKEVGINQHGLLSIVVMDSETKKPFELDGMSSGEKGLILTYLLIELTIVEGGIILLDEPELHLNPAVCRNLLNFLIEEYVQKKNIQIIICSHSPEILAGAFESDECSLYHLVSPTLLTKVRQHDEAVVAEALQKLGASEIDGLLYKATVFVEGPEDVELFETGFDDKLRRYKLHDLGGRPEVEKQIIKLQQAEKEGTEFTKKYFIFDRDRSPTDLQTSNYVRLAQLDKTCIENYLIEVDVLANLLMKKEVTKTPFKSHSEVEQILKRTALSQLDDVAARKVYAEYNYENPGMRPFEILGKTAPEMAEILFDRLELIKTQISALDRNSWIQQFEQKLVATRKLMEKEWNNNWKNICDGKRLFKELQPELKLNFNLISFKKRIMLEMKHKKSLNWRELDKLLSKLFDGN